MALKRKIRRAEEMEIDHKACAVRILRPEKLITASFTFRQLLQFACGCKLVVITSEQTDTIAHVIAFTIKIQRCDANKVIKYMGPTTPSRS